MSALDLAAIRTRANNATFGPWEAYLDPEVERYDPTICANGHVVARLNDETEWDDVQFIAAARTDVPALCDEVERLRAACRAILAMHDGPPDGVGNWDHAFDQLRAATEEAP